ncbi:inorganic phosphate transporter [Methermicoccus shengliensis]|uniref:Phosphate transporter n=1 Tax=Methermicoccus shengliensis TaxID=660064 RepID=A0A832RSE9_9EURY|nr:inorganic phosphate transporter [Methermicoccus shengliensis]KUK05030.1 MAG: Phosphate transporter [Euryarchaeota archaeon 55_53]KUK30240.1 MAG: Phosphate transporter [Methanosarcinales archeaon 56_1174]MDI3487586.1 inorganic phosphate transporter, PiT family [Methanosarcinales archaeon]HIH69448.1 inorganic phosphate transporter [Methermicoccus shengliensis]
MVGAEVVIGAIIFLALIFDFLNGFHDAANAIATVVATRVLTPLQAVGLAATFNLLGPLVFTTAVAKTVGRGIVVPDVITLSVLAATLIGAISWNLITWWFGLPISSSHSLIGGLIGAAVAANGWGVVYLPSTSLLASLLFYSLLAVAVCCVGWLTIHKVLHIDISNRTVLIGVLLGFAVGIPMITLTGRIPVGGISAVVLFMAVAPILGLCGGFFVASLVIRLFRRYTAETMNKYFRRLQLVSASFYSLTHGANDAQKTMGIITLLLFSQGMIPSFEVPVWVILSASGAMALGTFFGGWRIVATMAKRVTKLRPYQGFCAESTGGMVLALMAVFGIPVSTTQVISGSIMGVGMTKSLTSVRWGVARQIVGAWILTIPAAAVVGALAEFTISTLF